MSEETKLLLKKLSTLRLEIAEEIVNDIFATAKRVIVESEELKQWVSDCQSGMYINCVYCGHRYGPKDETPISMANVLKEHIEQCPKHPMSKLKAENEKLRKVEKLAKKILAFMEPGKYGFTMDHLLNELTQALDEVKDDKSSPQTKPEVEDHRGSWPDTC
jgi:hypothetical protein